MNRFLAAIQFRFQESDSRVFILMGNALSSLRYYVWRICTSEGRNY